MASVARYLLKTFWILCAVLLIGLAVLVQSGRSLFPLLNNYPDTVSEYLSDTLELNIRFARLEAEWDGLKPSVRLHELVIDDREGNRLTRADQAQLRLNLFSSLLQARLAWDKIELRRAHLSLRQGDDGYWGLPGQRPQQEVDPVAPDDLLTLFQLGTRVELLESQIQLTFASDHEIKFVAPYLLLEHQNDFHRLSLQLDVEEQTRALQVVVEGRGDPRNPEAFATRGYLQLRRFPTLEPLTALGGILLGESSHRDWYREGRMDASLWFSSQPDGAGYDLNGHFALDRVFLPVEDLTLDRVNARISGEWRRSGQWQLALHELLAEWEDRQLEPLHLAASAAGPRAPLQLMVDQLDLGYWSGLSEQLGLLGEGRLREVIQTLDPEGQAHKLQFTLPQDDWRNWQLIAELQQVSVAPWQGVPGLDGVSGFVEADQRGGTLDLRSKDGFSMYFAKAYDRPMTFDTASGQIAWHLDPDNNRVYVNSGPLEVSSPGEQARGHMWLALPWKPNTGDVDLYLDIYGHQLSAGLYPKYLPKIVPRALVEWLDRSVGTGNPGVAERAHFIFRGTLNEPDPLSRHYELSLDLSDVDLGYHREWPAAMDIQGTLNLDNNRVEARIDSALVYNSRINDTRVVVDQNPEGEGALLQINGAVDGLASDGLRLLRESYLRRFVGNNMDSWFLHGDLDADLELAIPLEPDQPGARQQVDMTLDVPIVTMDDLDLEMSQLRGRMSYGSDTGLNAARLRATLFDEPLAISITSDESAQGDPVTRIDFSGEVASERLAQWSRRPEVRFLSGKLAYDSRLELTHHREPEPERDQRLAALSVSSDLEGVALDLPEPYGKGPQGRRPMQFNYILGRQSALVDLHYDDRLQVLAQLDRDTAQLRRFNLALGVDASLPEQPGIHLSGRLDAIHPERWQAVLDQYQAHARDLGGTEGEGEAASLLAGLPLSADIELGQHQLGPLDLRDLALDLEQSESGWRLGFRNQMLAGDLNWQADQPMDLSIDYLRLPAGLLEGEAEGDSAEPFDPRTLPAARVNLQELQLGGEDFGRWRFDLGPEAEGLRVSDIRGQIRGLEVTGLDQAEGGELFWQYGEDRPERSAIGVHLSAGDLSEVLARWGQADMIESESADYQLTLSWPGPPQSIAAEKLRGDVQFNVQSGRFKRNPAAGSEGLLRLFSVLNFDSLARRLRLDFSDLYQSGLAYDSIEGKMRFNQGMMNFVDPVLVRSPSSRLQLSGRANLLDETLDTRLVATLPVAGNLTFLAALAGGLPAAVGVYLVSKLFEKQVDQATSITYTIRGDWDDPQIKFDRMFEGEASFDAEPSDSQIPTLEEPGNEESSNEQ